MTELTLKDNAITNKEKFEKISLLTQRIADQTLVQLGKEGIFIFQNLLKMPRTSPKTN